MYRSERKYMDFKFFLQVDKTSLSTYPFIVILRFRSCDLFVLFVTCELLADDDDDDNDNNSRNNIIK